jgi:hypothetical protein
MSNAASALTAQQLKKLKCATTNTRNQLLSSQNTSTHLVKPLLKNVNARLTNAYAINPSAHKKDLVLNSIFQHGKSLMKSAVARLSQNVPHQNSHLLALTMVAHDFLENHGTIKVTFAESVLAARKTTSNVSIDIAQKYQHATSTKTSSVIKSMTAVLNTSAYQTPALKLPVKLPPFKYANFTKIVKFNKTANVANPESVNATHLNAQKLKSSVTNGKNLSFLNQLKKTAALLHTV